MSIEEAYLTAASFTEPPNSALTLHRPAEHLALAWQHIDTAQLLTEHALRGDISLLDSSLPQKIFLSGMYHALLSRHRFRERANTPHHHLPINVLAARAPLGWLGCIEQRQAMSLGDVWEAYQAEIDASLVERLYRASGNETPHEDGYLFEQMIASMAMHNQRLRKADILVVPASPRLEQGGPSNPRPSDLAIWHCKKDKTAELIGGIQCTSKNRGNRGRGPRDKSNFTIKIIGRRRFSDHGDSLRAIMNRWFTRSTHTQDTMEHDFDRAIDNSDNDTLKELLAESA